MFNEVFPYLIRQFATIVNFVFNLKINENPTITFGEFILTFAFIGLVIYFIFGSDFVPNISFTRNINRSSNSKKGGKE